MPRAKRQQKRQSCPPHVYQCASCAAPYWPDDLSCSKCGAGFVCAKCGHRVLTAYELAVLKHLQSLPNRISSQISVSQSWLLENVIDVAWFRRQMRAQTCDLEAIRVDTDANRRELQRIQDELRIHSAYLQRSLPLRAVISGTLWRLWNDMRWRFYQWREKRKKKLTPAPEMTQVPKAPAPIMQAQNRKWPRRF